MSNQTRILFDALVHLFEEGKTESDPTVQAIGRAITEPIAKAAVEEAKRTVAPKQRMGFLP